MLLNTSKATHDSDRILNRTGIGMSPVQGPEMLNGTADPRLSAPSSAGDEHELERVRSDYASQAEPLGSMPPPSSLKGIAKTALALLKGKQPTVLLDKLGERLAFERTGSRLYEALLAKHDAFGSWEGGPTRAALAAIHDDELRHFQLLTAVVESLGADPTVMTPSADLAAVESCGLLQVLTDSRTNLMQGLHAILVAELADRDGWQALCELARVLGMDELARQFQSALMDEERHLAAVRSWVLQTTERLAQGELRSAT